MYGSPLPVPPPGTTNTQLATGSFGRINDPNQEDPYVQKFSLGFQNTIGQNWSISSDFIHTLGIHESRVQNINPRIAEVCNASFPNSRPTDPRCARGANSRYFDLAFVQAGLGAGRLEQINMIGNTNRSQFNSWVTTLKGHTGKVTMSLSYILAYSNSWGGQPVASYTGNGIAITPERQFLPGEFGPTRIDERNRIVASGVVDLPAGFQVAPLIQFATARPYAPTVGFDLDGDGLTTLDRLCDGTNLDAVFAVRGNSTAIRALNPLGCAQTQVNSERKGVVVDANGNVQERSGNFFNVDLRITKTFNVGKTLRPQVYFGLYNLFNTENLSYAARTALTPATSRANFLQPVSLYGPGFGPPPGGPFTAAFGIRFDF